MEVDFVRVWECAETPETLEACGTVNPDAQHVAGSQPRAVADADVDSSFLEGDEVTIFDDAVGPPFATGFWADSGSVEVSEVDDAERGTVTRFEYNADQSVAYFQSAHGYDFSDFAAL